MDGTMETVDAPGAPLPLRVAAPDEALAPACPMVAGDGGHETAAADARRRIVEFLSRHLEVPTA